MLDEEDKLLVARIKEIALAAEGGDEHAVEILEEVLDQVEDRDQAGEGPYDGDDDLGFTHFEVRCWGCGVILTTVERGPEWQQDFYLPRSMKCSRCQR